jgi:type IV pilus biogenesis protein CpaD/CtpE
MNTRTPLALAVGALLLSGCATYATTRTGRIDPADFGEANRQTYAAMVVNPEPVYTEEMPARADGAAKAIERVREDQVKQPDSIRSTEGSDGPGGR